MTERIREFIQNKKTFGVSFWRTDCGTYENAKGTGAAYSVPCLYYGWDSYRQAMIAAREAANCMDYDSRNYLMVHLEIDHTFSGDFIIEYCY